jgi:hypothetical protein
MTIWAGAGADEAFDGLRLDPIATHALLSILSPFDIKPVLDFEGANTAKFSETSLDI